MTARKRTGKRRYPGCLAQAVIGMCYGSGGGGGSTNFMHSRSRMTITIDIPSLQCRHGPRRVFTFQENITCTKGGGPHLMLALVIWLLTTHRFRDNAPFVLLIEASSTFGRFQRFFPVLLFFFAYPNSFVL